LKELKVYSTLLQLIHPKHLLYEEQDNVDVWWMIAPYVWTTIWVSCIACGKFNGMKLHNSLKLTNGLKCLAHPPKVW